MAGSGDLLVDGQVKDFDLNPRGGPLARQTLRAGGCCGRSPLDHVREGSRVDGGRRVTNGLRSPDRNGEPRFGCHHEQTLNHAPLAEPGPGLAPIDLRPTAGRRLGACLAQIAPASRGPQRRTVLRSRSKRRASADTERPSAR